MTKRICFWTALAPLVAAVLAMATYMFVPQPKIGCDFDLRTNEIACVLEGVDPFDVWSGKVERAPYCPMERTNVCSDPLMRRVNAYPPWAYTFGWPLTWLPQRTSWYLYFAFHFLVLAGLGFAGYRYAKAELGDADAARLAAVVPLLLISLSVGSCFMSGNYPIVVLVATLGLVWSLNRGHDVLAGFCWALAMIKPQMALLYAVPLLFRRKFLTCAVAAVTCLVASVPPMLLCHKGLVELIRNSVGAAAGIFNGCGTFPGFLVPLFGQSLSINLGLAVGLLLCVAVTWRTPRATNWLVYLTPAVFIGTAWSYAQLYCSVVNWLPLLLIIVALLRQPQSKALWCVFVMAVLFMTRVYTFYHGFTMLFPARFGYSWALHGTLDSLNSLFGLVIGVWFWHRAVMCRAERNGILQGSSRED